MPITFIITAHNEERAIENKINNTLALDYPKDKLQILVASDNSVDNTNHLVTSFSSQGVELLAITEGKGKENAQGKAIDHSTGDILVFSDVSTMIKPDALRKIAAQFVDSEIGALSSEDRFILKSGEVAGESAYVKYEMWLRKLESEFNTLVGLSGSFFAARKQVCSPWKDNIPSDFNTAINCSLHNKRAITAPEILGYYQNLQDDSKEYRRKLRTVIRGIAALYEQRQCLNPFKNGRFSFQLISHKLMRWLTPWFLLATFVINLLLLEQHWFFQLTLAGQGLFYTTAALGFLVSQFRSILPIKICFFFVQVNVAIMHATMLFLTGQRITQWEPSQR